MWQLELTKKGFAAITPRGVCSSQADPLITSAWALLGRGAHPLLSFSLFSSLLLSTPFLSSPLLSSPLLSSPFHSSWLPSWLISSHLISCLQNEDLKQQQPCIAECHHHGCVSTLGAIPMGLALGCRSVTPWAL